MAVDRLWSGVLIASVMGAFALPQPSSAQALDRDKPIAFGANELTRTETRVLMRGAAEFTQGETRLRANAAEAYVLNGTLTRVEASGDVFFVTVDQTVRADRATYTPESDLIILTGDVILVQGENVLTGGRLTYNTRTEAARMEGGADGRVRGVFYPGAPND